MIENFYFHNGVFNYGFGDNHPLKPERLHRLFALLDCYQSDYIIQTEAASGDDLERVHSQRYVDAVRKVSKLEAIESDADQHELMRRFGFYGDNPAFPGMFEAASAYSGATAAAARAVVDGAPIAFGIGGGLHHAMREKASGFCVFNDCAIGCSILRDKFARVAYVDIDVHHGDGVQQIFYDDPTVLTCSIHEEGATLWPGTGWTEETGAEFTSFNVPVAAGTTAEVWSKAFDATILPALHKWKPEAIILQIGSDSHYLDPLAHVQCDQTAWLNAALAIQALGTPLVVVGGGGYNLTTVPRMWASAILSLSGIQYDDEIPLAIANRVGAKTFSDVHYPYRGKRIGEETAQRVIEKLSGYNIPNLQSP